MYLYAADLASLELVWRLCARSGHLKCTRCSEFVQVSAPRQGHAAELRPRPREAAPLTSRHPRLSAPGFPSEPPPGLQSFSGPSFSEPGRHQEEPPGFPAGIFDKKTEFWAWAAALPRLLFWPEELRSPASSRVLFPSVLAQ